MTNPLRDETMTDASMTPTQHIWPQSEREPTLWTCDDAPEDISADSIEEAVHEWADHIWPDPLPAEVVVYGYAAIVGPDPSLFARTALDSLIESLDADYGPEEGSDVTPGMVEAAETFAKAVLAEYYVWRCTRVVTRTVKVADYYKVQP